MADRLMSIDYLLTPADALIMGAALVDQNCRRLYATDDIMLQGIRLHEIAREHGTKVTEPPGLTR
ncbi:MAG: hypothetical protein LN415_06965 [Candidatus Thermoplasmatota archaeon]|nr:hypothetical protein [Candidatus Thermoplasmatota archaeon]